MLQHLLFLRPSIEGVSLTTENIIFKLVYAVSCPLFLAFGVIFYTRVCFTDAINCVLNSSESFKVLKAIDSYCLENSYITRDSDDQNDEYSYQRNYQYVGLFFVVSGALCYLPYVLWEWFENGLLKSLLQDLASITLVEEDKFASQITKLTTIWRRNRAMLETYAYANILCEACNLFALLVVFALGDIFLDGHFFNITEDAFPKTAECSWDTGSSSGKGGHVFYVGVCTMNMNYLSEKLFFLAWYVFTYNDWHAKYVVSYIENELNVWQCFVQVVAPLLHFFVYPQSHISLCPR